MQAGYCILGCSYDAKQSMLVTYVPRAASAGARIFSNARAERIDVANGRVRGVFGHVVDHAGRSRPRASKSARRSSCWRRAPWRRRICCCVRASPNRSGQVGRNLHLHPSVMVAGIFEDDFAPYRGIPQSYYVDEFIDLEADPHRGYVLMPITGFPVLTGGNLPGFGREHFRWMKSFSLMAGLLVLLHDRSAGSVASGIRVLATGASATSSPRTTKQQLAEGLVHCSEVLFAAGAREVLVPYWIDPLLLRPGDDLARHRAARRPAGRDRDRVDAPAVHLPDGWRPANLGGERLGRIARGRRTLRRGHERVPDVARSAPRRSRRPPSRIAARGTSFPRWAELASA